MMKSVLQTLQNQPCREREIGENEKETFSNYLHLQRYHPALDIFKIPESSETHKCFPNRKIERPKSITVKIFPNVGTLQIVPSLAL